jgi:hypothetical protein
MKIIGYIFVIVLIIGCNSTEFNSTGNVVGISDKYGIPISCRTKKIVGYSKNKKEIKVDYSFALFTAEAFLKKKQVRLTKKELYEIKGEYVLMYQIKTGDKGYKVTDLQSEFTTLDDKKKYLLQEVIDDIHLLQNDNVFYPIGHFYEDFNRSGQEMRIIFYFKNINQKQPVKVVINDRLINNGLLNFSLQTL